MIPPVIVTEIGLYKVAVLSSTPVGNQLRDFMAEVVMPAIQRGKSIDPHAYIRDHAATWERLWDVRLEADTTWTFSRVPPWHLRALHILGVP